MQRIRLTQDVGSAKKGTIYIQGLHGVPEHEIWNGKKPNQFYWEKGTTKDDNAFIYEKWLWGKTDDEEWNYAEIC